MKSPGQKLWLLLLPALICPTVRAQQTSTSPLPAIQVSQAKGQITFVSPNTFCHQGYATDGTNHYTFDNHAIYVWSNDLAWTSVASNTAVFQGMYGLNHLGDGDYCNGKLYVVGEWWENCVQLANQSIVVFDATTLQRLSVNSVSADAHEVSGLAVVPSDGPNGIIYVTSYCDGSQIWEYDLSTFALIGTLPLSQTIPYIQGIAWANGRFYISQDTGSIYSFDYSGNISQVFSTTIPGSHEGLKFAQGQIRWLIDGGPASKFIYYITLDGLVVSYPDSAAGWILEGSPGIGQPWTPLTGGFTATNSGVVNVTLKTSSQSMFYHLRQP